MRPIIPIGISGFRAAEARFQTAANSVVRAGALSGEGKTDAPKDDLATSLVALQLASYDFKAATKIVEVGRNMMKLAIDNLA